MNQQETNRLIDLALDGNAEGLEQLLASVQDMVFNLSLRMLGTVPDAEDAAQDILVRIMTSLSTFRKESSFQTWVYRIATNYLINYKKSMFARQPLDFEFYGNDIKYAAVDETEQLVDEMTRETMAEELKWLLLLQKTGGLRHCPAPHQSGETGLFTVETSRQGNHVGI